MFLVDPPTVCLCGLLLDENQGSHQTPRNAGQMSGPAGQKGPSQSVREVARNAIRSVGSAYLAFPKRRRKSAEKL